MKHFRLLSIFFALVLLLFSACKDKVKEGDAAADESTISIGKSTISIPETDTYVSKIDGFMEDTMAYIASLDYSNDKESRQVKGFLLDSFVVKFSERFQNKEQNTLGHRVYYMKNNELVFAREIRQEQTPDSLGQMHEIVSYYKNGAVTQSGERFAPYEEDLPNMDFQKCAKYTFPFENLSAMMNRTGRFTTNFLGFIESGSYLFLWVGENDKEGLTSALLIEERDKFMAELIQNPKPHLGQHLDLNFELMNIQGVTYQVYRGASFTKK